jgi:pyruvate kinase
MARIIAAAEGTEIQQNRRSRAAELTGQQASADYARSISYAARGLAEDLGAVAIVGVTRTGHTAHLLSTTRPNVPVVALTPDEGVCRRLALWWGVDPIRVEIANDVEALFPQIDEHMLSAGMARPADTVLVVGSMPLQIGVHTNFVKVHRIGDAGPLPD